MMTWAADAFVDSVGINLHLHYTDTPYFTAWPDVKTRLLALGLRHYRDGIVNNPIPEYYARIGELHHAGLRGSFIAPAESDVAAFLTTVGAAAEALEGPNEWDLNGGEMWAQDLRAAMQQLWSERAGLPVLAPSVTSREAFAALGDISAFCSASNLHNYFAGRHPESDGWGDAGYGSIDYWRTAAQAQAPRRPIVTTETGYFTYAAVRDYAPEDVVARYLPRLLLEQFRKGIARTYLYEFVDFPRQGVEGLTGYGLLRTDVTPKPSYVVLSSLLALLADPGPAITVEPLAYRLTGGSLALRSMAFQKRGGQYLIAVWLAVPSWDPVTEQRSALSPAEVVKLSVPIGYAVSGKRTGVIAVTDAVRWVEVERSTK